MPPSLFRSTACRFHLHRSLWLPTPPRLFTSLPPPPPPRPPPPQLSRPRLLAAALTALTGLLAALSYGSTTSSSPQSLNTTHFTPYTLTSKTPITTTITTTTTTTGPSQTAIFTLTPPKPTAEGLPFERGVLSIQVKQPQLQIARSYTPLPAQKDDGDIRLLIRREPGGEMSRYLYSLREGDVVEIRGPGVECAYPPEGGDGRRRRRVVFFAGGTGIAPALQVAAWVLRQGGKGEVEVEVLWAVRREEEMGGAMRGEIERVKEMGTGGGGRLVVRRFVDADGGIKMSDVEKAIAVDGKKTGCKVFVSGPEGFIAWIAGPKDFRGGREEQGPLGGMLKAAAERNGGDIEVLKL